MNQDQRELIDLYVMESIANVQGFENIANLVSRKIIRNFFDGDASFKHSIIFKTLMQYAEKQIRRAPPPPEKNSQVFVSVHISLMLSLTTY